MSLPDLQQVQQLERSLRAGVPVPVRESEFLDRALDATRALERSLRELSEKRLVVGLLGGTGVGKSTLLNAIAGAVISRPGDRRPTTDRIVTYRHEDFPLPPWLDLSDLADPPPPHQIEGLRGVILLDLPDVDSRAREHCERVHRVLPKLDLLLVVTSVEKYGDDALYHEIKNLPQAPRNAIFVLNAIDRISTDDLARVRQDFLDKLHRFAGLTQPTLLVMSARLATTEPGRAGDFDELLARLDRLGGDRERQAVLAANAEVRLESALSVLDQSFPEAAVEAWLEELWRVPHTLPMPAPSALQALHSQLEATLTPWATARALRSSSFPISFLHFFLRKLGRAARESATDPFQSGRDPAHGFTEDLLHRPLRLARHSALAALRSQESRLRIRLPEDRADDPIELLTFRASWSERLHRRTERWGWRLRQHVFPGLTFLTWLGWSLASFVPEPGSDHSWLASMTRGVVSILQSLSPTTLVTVAVLLMSYYAIVYPYFLYRLEGRTRAIAREGVDGNLAAWKAMFARAWGTPLRAEIEAARGWWKELTRARAALARHGSRRVT